MHVYAHKTCTQTPKFILILLHSHQQDRYLCADDVTNSLHIVEHLAMHQKSRP